jgi:hypothetical protein
VQYISLGGMKEYCPCLAQKYILSGIREDQHL